MEVTDEMKQALTNIQHGFQLISCEGGVKLVFNDSFLEKALTRIIELHEANKPKPEPVGLGEEWMPCIKLPVIVHVRKQRQDEQHVSTREGITPVRPDDLIMRGVSGEEYPIGSEIFNKTYTLDTTPPTREPLSDYELNEILNDIAKGDGTIHDFAKAIEQAHGIGAPHEPT